MDVTAELIHLYRQHPADAIESNGALLLAHFQVADRDALLSLPGYPQAYGLVSACAAQLRGLAQRHPDAADQARETVRLLRDLKDSGESTALQQVMRQLAEGRHRASWPAAAQALYDQKVQILDWRDFFVSYTDRDAPALNRQFKRLIVSGMGKFPRGTELQHNHVARVLTRHLRRYQQLDGFFAETDMLPGERIQNGVDGYCRRAFALVQLIEPLSFEREPPRNWCFYEYQEFTDNPDIGGLVRNKDRHFFILAEASLTQMAPANLAPAQQHWLQRIEALKQTHIDLTTERNESLRTKMQAVAKRILALRREVIDAWLAP